MLGGGTGHANCDKNKESIIPPAFFHLWQICLFVYVIMDSSELHIKQHINL